MIVVIMVAVLRYYGARNFADYVNKMEMARLDTLVQKLAVAYRQDQGWERLRHNFPRWHELTRPQRHRGLPHPPGPPPGPPEFAGPEGPPGG